MINLQRLAQRFKTLVEIDSLSRHEQDVAKKIEKILTDMGAEVCYDTAKNKVNGNCSNLVAKFKGSVKAEPVFLSGHMDTVGPGNNIQVQFKKGIFTSDGTTILGSDDKSAIAIILEAMDVIFENRLDHPPIEIVLTVCEEIGLLGAKNLDYSLMDSKFGYILDSSDTSELVTKSPAANKIHLKVYGRAAHSGLEPEKGINAIKIASEAVSRLPLGRIDEETTCNLGKIKGGEATNIVPDFVEIHGEARSHDKKKIEAVTKNITDTFYKIAKKAKDKSGLPRVEAVVENDFPNTDIPDDHKVVLLAKKAAANIGLPLVTKTIGGCADANIFFNNGIFAGVLGTGMTDIHTLNESIDIKDMENITKLVLEILKIHATGTTD